MAAAYAEHQGVVTSDVESLRPCLRRIRRRGRL